MDQGLKYRRKPIVVSAWRYVDPSIRDIPSWLTEALNRWPGLNSIYFNERGHIDVRSAIMAVACPLGFWIIQEENDSLRIMADDVFNLIYEEVTDGDKESSPRQ